MTVPFMRAYSELLVATCHKRGAFAIGGQAPFVPSRHDPAADAKAIAKVRQDKAREAGDGYDGSWVAHPDFVAICREEFDKVLGERPNQISKKRDDVSVSAVELLDVKSTRGRITEAGLRNSVSVGLQYIHHWLSGTGAPAMSGLMEDVATAEISRSQLWQWIHNDVRLETGQRVTSSLVRQVIDEEWGGITDTSDDGEHVERRWREARDLFEKVALSEEYVDFLTLPAYEFID
jgi:malate synthase